MRGVWVDGDARAGDYWYDETHGEFAVNFFARCLTHPRDAAAQAGARAGEPFVLSPWQAGPTRAMFGWKRLDDHRRKIRRVFILVASGNGKSPWLAGIGILLLGWDGVPRAEIVNVAGDREQAGVVFEDSRSMVLASSYLSKRIKPFARSLVYVGEGPALGSNYKILSTDTGGRELKHGRRLTCVLIDEEHVLRGRQMRDTLVKMTAKSAQPLILEASTAGIEKEGTLCGDNYDYASSVRDGLVRDDELLPIIYECPKDPASGEYIDWKSEEALRAANPNLDVTIALDTLRKERQVAIDNPAEAPSFRRLRCNIWDKAVQNWLPPEQLERAKSSLPAAEFAASLRGRRCLAALDASDGLDLNSLCMIFPPTPEESAAVRATGKDGAAPESSSQGDAGSPADSAAAAPVTVEGAPGVASGESENLQPATSNLQPGVYRALWRHWIPEATLSESFTRTRQHARRYAPWTRNCWCRIAGGDVHKRLNCPAALHLTPGSGTDYDRLRAEINALRDRYDFFTVDPEHPGMPELAADPHETRQLITQLVQDGWLAFAHYQSTGAMNPGIGALERLLARGELQFSGDPVVAWSFGNVQIYRDYSGKKRFEKASGQGQRGIARVMRKIDPWVAAAMAAGRAALAQPAAHVWFH